MMMMMMTGSEWKEIVEDQGQWCVLERLMFSNGLMRTDYNNGF